MSIEIAKKIIENSGNSFHYKIVDFFRDNNWIVKVSPYYNDNATDKPREIDIIAEKEYHLNERINMWLGSVNVRLFIECKYITKDTVFWFDKKDKEGALTRVLDDTPLDDPSESSETARHRYMKDDLVAKLFSTAGGREPENDVIYKALNQSLNALIYHRNRPSIIPMQKSRRYNNLATLTYPIIICNDFQHFYKHEVNVSDDPLNITDNFSLEVNYAYLDTDKKPKNEFFLLDMVKHDSIQQLLDDIEKIDVECIKDKLLWDFRTR